MDSRPLYQIIFTFFSKKCSLLGLTDIFSTNHLAKAQIFLPFAGSNLYLNMKSYAYILLLVVAMSSLSFNRRPAPPHSTANEIMVLATHYLSYAPAQGAVFDVLAPEKQAEMQELTAMLSRFRPTRIALDIPANSQWDTLVNSRFQTYLAGHRQLGRSVEEQVGFRLAEMTGQQHLYAIGNSRQQNQQWVQPASNQEQQRLQSSMQALVQQRTISHSQQLISSNMADFFRYLNAPEMLKKEQGLIRNHLDHIARQDYMLGSTLAAAWYRLHRERLEYLREFMNPTGERAVVIVPATYAPLLRELIRKDPEWKLVEPQAYLAPN